MEITKEWIAEAKRDLESVGPGFRVSCEIGVRCDAFESLLALALSELSRREEEAGDDEAERGPLDLLPCANCGGVGAFGIVHEPPDDDCDYTSERDGGEYIECGNAACKMSTPLMFSVMDDCKPLLAEVWNHRPIRRRAEQAKG